MNIAQIVTDIFAKKAKCLVCECDYNQEEFVLPCGCQICKECFLEWVYAENKENEFIYEAKFSCSNHKCKKKIEYDKIIDFFSKEEKEKINDILFKKYMNNNPDTRKCPKKECPFGGWMIFDDKNICKEKLVCELCNTEWIDETMKIYNYGEYINNMFSNTKKFILEDLSRIHVRFFSKPCPRCAIQIYKYQGCDHMNCPKCELSYCYNCNRVHVNPEDTEICQYKYGVFAFSLTIMIFLIVLKLILCFNIFYLICYYYLWFVLINIIYILYILLLYCGLGTSINLLCGYRDYYRRTSCFKFCELIFSLFAASLFSSHIYLYFNSETINYYSKIMFWELIIIIALYIMISILMIIFKNR